MTRSLLVVCLVLECVCVRVHVFLCLSVCACACMVCVCAYNSFCVFRIAVCCDNKDVECLLIATHISLLLLYFSWCVCVGLSCVHHMMIGSASPLGLQTTLRYGSSLRVTFCRTSQVIRPLSTQSLSTLTMSSSQEVFMILTRLAPTIPLDLKNTWMGTYQYLVD